MKIIVNGESKEYEKSLTIQELIDSLKINGKVMATAINMEVVKKDKWSTHQIKDGDKVEFLQFVGGG
jgi:sulfur carrier protein